LGLEEMEMVDMDVLVVYMETKPLGKENTAPSENSQAGEMKCWSSPE